MPAKPKRKSKPGPAKGQGGRPRITDPAKMSRATLFRRKAEAKQ